MNFPEKIFVARRFVSGDQVDGYIIDATKMHTKAFENKKERVEYWARTNNMPSLILDNEPKKGFAIVQKLIHSGRDTYFVCRHPEGFEFNITANNMLDLITHNDIVNGVFQDAMFFNNNLELINGNTKTFAKMQEKQEKAEERKSVVGELKVGDGFLYNKKEYYYCGRVHALCLKKTKEFSLPNKSSFYHMVYCIADGTYGVCASLDRYELTPRALHNVKTTMEAEIVKANAYFNTYQMRTENALGECNKPVLISTKSFKSTDMKVKYTEITKDVLVNGRFNENVLFMTEQNGQKYRVFFGISDNNSRNSYGYYRHDYSIAYKGDFEKYCGYPVEVDANGVMSMDVDIDEHTSFNTWRGYNSPFYPPTKRYSNNTSESNKKPMVHISTDCPIFYGTYYL